MSNKFNSLQKVEETKEIELDILEKEDDAFIVLVGGWRMRVYFNEGYELTSGRLIAKYTGDITDAHSVKFEKLK